MREKIIFICIFIIVSIFFLTITLLCLADSIRLIHEVTKRKRALVVRNTPLPPPSDPTQDNVGAALERNYAQIKNNLGWPKLD